MHALHNRDPRRVSIPALSAYDSAGFELRDAHIVRSIAPDQFSHPRSADRRTGAGRNQERDPHQAAARDRQGCRHGDPARLVQGSRAGAARPHRAPLADRRQEELRRRRQAGLLPLTRISDWPAVHRRPEQYGAVEGVRDRARRSRRQPGGSAQMRAGCRARQWRLGAAGGVLHGQHGDARHPRHRLRHPLRFRPVPPGHRAGLAAGISRRVAELRQPLGIPAAGSGLSRAFRRRRRTCRGQGPRPRDLASLRDRAGGRL